MDAVQDRYSPNGTCFGCGPKNEKGLRIKSRWDGDDFVASWRPEPHHAAFPGVLNGGIVGALLDCHSNWCAVTALMRRDGLDEAPPTVTAEFHVRLRRPTPMDQPVTLNARPTKLEGDTVTVEAELASAGRVCATCTAVLVRVQPGHPAYHRWE